MDSYLSRSKFRIRPSVAADRAAIAKHIFGDVEVAKTLVHNVSTTEAALIATDAWVDTLAVDGKNNPGNPQHIGLWTVIDEANEGRFVGLRGVFEAPGLPSNSVATFAAVARDYWRKGVSGDTSFLLCKHVFETSDVEAIFTRVWPKLNPASDAVQRRLGFVPSGRHTLTDTFGSVRMSEVLEFDLWRVSKFREDDFEEPLRQVSVRIGQLAEEGLISEDLAVDRIMAALPDRIARSEGIRTRITTYVRVGLANPAWASYRLSRDNWAKHPGHQSA